MKKLLLSLMSLGLTAAVSTAAEAKTLKKFSTSDPIISKDLKKADGNSWHADLSQPQTLRLYEVPNPGVEECMLIYRAKIKTEGLKGKAYLEMWCRFPGKGEFFSRGLQNSVTGSNDWASYETPFFLKAGEKPDLLKLNLVANGTGSVWIKDVELIKAPLSKMQ